MKNKKTIFGILSLALLILVLNAGESFAQPSNAQLKKVLTSPRTVSVTLDGPGKIEWSSTYKKYVWSRYFTAKLRTDAPGELLIVKGYASYDVMGGRYVFWRTFTSSNSYEGKKNVTVAEINQALETAELSNFNHNRTVIGEYETMKLAAAPDWEWHTLNSVSFNVVAVFRRDALGRYGNEAYYSPPAGFRAVDRVEAFLRIRLYRDGAKLLWRGVYVGSSIPTFVGSNSTEERVKLLERKEYPEAQFNQMARMNKIPLLTQ